MNEVKRGMKSKTIKTVLRKKFNEFANSIEDAEVKKLVEKNSIITGGAIASMLLGESVNDYDIYFTNIETVRAVADYYVARFEMKQEGIQVPITVEEDAGRIRIVIKSAGIAADGDQPDYDYFETRSEEDTSGYVSELMSEDPGEIEDLYEDTKELVREDEEDKSYRPVFLSTNAITLSNKIQIVLRFYGDAEKIHKNYDFVHCTNYWTSDKSELVLKSKALECLLARELRYVGSLYPVCSIFRLRKFLRRGFTINAGQMLKIMMQISALDLTDVKVLEDQLTGVDAAYFIQLITKLKEKDPEKVNSAYLIEIIDRMF